MASIAMLARLSVLTLLLAFLALIAALSLAMRQAALAQHEAEWALHTQTVLAASAESLQRVTDLETAARGYALSGDPTFRTPAQGAAQDAHAALDRLRALVADNPPQQERARALEQLATSRLQHLHEVLDAAARGASSEAEALVKDGRGRELMDLFRAATARFQAVEEGLLRERRARMAEAALWTRVALIVLALASATLAAAAVVLGVRVVRRLQAAEARARIGEARLRVTLRSCGDGIIATDTGGRITMINPVAQALTGWREDQASGLPVEQVFRIVNEITGETVESPVGRVLREGKVVGLANHTVLIARDGAQRPIDDSGAPIRDENDEALGAILVFRDVSGRKASEAARERLVRAEAERAAAVSANRAKDEFLALVSHELRTPLAAMRGWLDLLVAGLVPDAERGGALQRILRNAHLQERLIADLLDISRIRHGKLEVLRAPVDLVPLAAGALTAFRSPAQEKGVTLAAELPQGPIFVKGDEDRLSQVIQNLLSNAIKFTPAGGRVALTVVREGSRARITVSDTGIGLTPEVREHLFDPFWQADDSLARRQGGLGLGLAICKHLVDAHDGSLRAESAGPGQGTTLHVELPLPEISAQQTAAASAVPDAPSLEGLRVLVVDDDADGRLAIVTYLRRLGATASEASSVETALDVLRVDGHDVVLSDIGMPTESGLTLARRLREGHEGAPDKLVLLAMSGFTSGTARRVALDSGFDAMVNKPVDLRALAALLKAVARTRPSR